MGGGDDVLSERPQDSWRYQKELPKDSPQIQKAWLLLEKYSGVAPEEVDEHVAKVRDKAFAIFPYPCIGRWRFLDLYLTTMPEYPTIISRLQAGASLLDVGCCFGHILRQLAFDGAPATHLAGTDLRREFIDLGYDLFRDKATFPGRFVTGDILDAADPGLQELDGQFDLLHVASFFHLFSLEDQIRVAERIVRFLKPQAKALIVGRQVGSFAGRTVERPSGRVGTRFEHNLTTMQEMWDLVGEKTGTKWRVSGEVFESRFDEVHRVIIRFAVARVD